MSGLPQFDAAMVTLGDAGLNQAPIGTSEPSFSDWLWLLAGCAVFLASLIALFRARKRRNGVSAHTPARQPSATQKLAMLKPVIEQVRDQHRLSRYGFDICPENIRIVRGRAVLRLRKATLRGDGMMALCPGYSAPERYDTAQPVGPWTDIYAVSALVFDAITGTAPPPAFERNADEPVFSASVQNELKPLADAVELGLAVDCRKRPASLDGVLTELQHVLELGGTSETVSNQSESKSQVNQKREGKGRRIAMIASAACVLLGGALLVLETNYAQALTQMEAGAFVKAARSINGVPAFYRDAGDLQRYVEAVNLLEEGDFAQAAALLEALGDYRDARQMTGKAAYQSAAQMLDAGLFDEAQAAFAALGDYADAPQMVTEARYRKAAAVIEEGRLTEAKAAIEALHPYKDSAGLLAGLTERIYAQALSLYEQGLFAKAAACFASVPNYKETDSYAALCELAARIEQNDFSREHFELLMTYAADYDIAGLVLSDAAILYYLEGSWRDGAAGHDFALHEDGSISCSLPLPGGSYYELRGASLMVGQSAADTQALVFEYQGADSLRVYCLLNDKQYVFTRRR